LDHLRQQPWPGNVRELRNALERAAIVARGGPLLPEHSQERPIGGPEPGHQLDAAVRHWARQLLNDHAPPHLIAALQKIIEPALIDEVLHRAAGNRSLAAEWLGLDRATVRKKIQQYGLECDSSEPV